MLRPLLDSLPWWALFLVLVAILMLVAEVTFQIGRHRRSEADEHKKSHAGLIVGSLLALLGLLLAFSFSIAESRYQMRKELVLEEANAIERAYLLTDMLPPGRVEHTKDLLRHYVDLRLGVGTPDEMQSAVVASARIHDDLWAEGVAAGREEPWSRYIPLFVEALNDVIDIQQSRVTYAEHYRLPLPILWSLFLVSTVALAVLGYVAGLGRTRSLWPTLAVVTAIAAVLVLVVELDRPWARMFEISQDALIDVRGTISNGR